MFNFVAVLLKNPIIFRKTFHHFYHYNRFRPAYSAHAMSDILTSTLHNINVNENIALPLVDMVFYSSFEYVKSSEIYQFYSSYLERIVADLKTCNASGFPRICQQKIPNFFHT